MLQYRRPQILAGSKTNADVPQDHSITGQAVSGTRVFYSQTQRISGSAPQLNLHLSVTGTPTGTFSIQQSNDPRVDDGVDVVGDFASAQAQTVRWAEVATVAVTAGSMGGGTPAEYIVSIQNGAYATRVVYTNSSGSGTIIVVSYGVGG